MYAEPNHDVSAIRQSLGDALPVGGFFANGEIGPVDTGGLAPPREGAEGTQLHGFTSVLALLYEQPPREGDADGETQTEPPAGA